FATAQYLQIRVKTQEELFWTPAGSNGNGGIEPY
ncbi:hypothetical protein CSAL01_10663, partial [Colletotrichum salicis]